MSIVLSAKGGGERVRCHSDASGVPKRGFVVCGGLVESKPYFFLGSVERCGFESVGGEDGARFCSRF